MHRVRTNISSIYYFTEIPIILKQHIQSDWITNELRKPWGDVLGNLSAHGYSKLWRTSFSMNKPTTWCKSGRVSLVSSSCLYKTQPERTDKQTDKVKPVYPPFNFVEAGGIMKEAERISLLVGPKSLPVRTSKVQQDKKEPEERNNDL